MMTSKAGLGLIKHFEGFSAKPYVCSGGKLTIGYGHVVKPHERARFERGITEKEAEVLLQDDVRAAEAAVARLISVPLSQGQFDALVSFTFNLGAGALERSTLRRRLNAEDYASVPSELSRWIYAGGKRLAGLKRRREAEAALWMSA